MSLWQRLRRLLKFVNQHKGFRSNSLKSFLSLFLVGTVLSLAIAGCSGNGNSQIRTDANLVSANKKDVAITLVSFTVTRAAYDQIIPKFREKWKKEQNQNVSIRTSYGASGSQTRGVIDGLPADIVHLALALDTSRIEEAGLIQPGWEQEVPNNGIVTSSVAALVTREGNPKDINNWADLAKDGVSFITADPKTSGVARWNLLALWNSAIKAGADETKATEFLAQAYSNVPILTRDAREATDAFFKQGQGDALINYENELILAGQKGEKISYSVPLVNISIDNPIAVVDKNVDRHGNREVTEAFLKYLFTPEAQEEFAKVGFRPVNESVAQNKEYKEKYPAVQNLAKVQDYGGWDEVQQKFFEDGAIFDQIQAKRTK
ncbi:sulfate ABC transporter substrate-binding protein [Plectonema cf. radiosum LEGE 06105]|uniref:Sulfate ABC transporter substrate-binding protein n=1 Tax=Plectonema cf. radiosum LEGE 06105 TaxID=945769 RepID=A0A8J7FDX7_9CYAN|nr:sulfate ABC transporter substrate-binding protein [Plectonema radiosum]MBE9215859.1 sulfate ABC transporter substrate-binding protein [Plectonema cf. radiosum LEGE 06105]